MSCRHTSSICAQQGLEMNTRALILELVDLGNNNHIVEARLCRFNILDLRSFYNCRVVIKISIWTQQGLECDLIV